MATKGKGQSISEAAQNPRTATKVISSQWQDNF